MVNGSTVIVCKLNNVRYWLKWTLLVRSVEKLDILIIIIITKSGHYFHTKTTLIFIG